MPIRQMILTVLAAITLCVSLAGCQIVQLPSITAAGDERLDAEAAQVAEIVRIVDGDTIAVAPTDSLPATNERGTEHYVRVLGIDAPEMNKMDEEPAECGAADATDHLVALLRDHPSIALVFDPLSDHTDRFGRSLAYVETLGDQPVDIGQEQVRAGFAEAWYPQGEPEPGRFVGYLEVQQEAAAAGAGAFGSCGTVGR